MFVNMQIYIFSHLEQITNKLNSDFEEIVRLLRVSGAFSGIGSSSGNITFFWQ